MRRWFFFPLAGLAVCGWLTAVAQTTPDAGTTIPAPVAAPAGSLPAQNPYELQQPARKPDPVVTRPVPAPAPAILPVKAAYQAYAPYGLPHPVRLKDRDSSSYIPLDSWIYPQLSRLYGMGYLNSMTLSMRPYTRRGVMHMLTKSEDEIMQGGDLEAQSILAKVRTELETEVPDGSTPRGLVYGVHQLYDRGMYVSGVPLRDSFHIGQTLVNDYGRPYQHGFNNLLGASFVAEKGRFAFYVRGEYQHAPPAPGYTDTLADYLSGVDQITPTGFNAVQATIPRGPMGSENPFRIVEGSVSFHFAGHEISGGKTDAWLGPAQGGAVAWSNNAENIYSFRINRVEPMYIPFVSKVLGPLRYDFFYGSLKGHTSPNSPYIHSEMFSFKPTVNFEFGFQRTIIFGGAGHSPVTFERFLHGFFDTGDTTVTEKYSRNDPGARFSSFNVSYRLPYLRKTALFYIDSITHDDVTPLSAPRRAAFRTGIFLSHLPRMPRADFRVEGVLTDQAVTPSFAGQFNYYETIQKQGYTNKGFILGDWMGREAKGGQAWMTYHVSPTESYEVEYLNKKNAKDFIDQGTTQHQIKFAVVKRFRQDYELNYWVQYERWKAPVYLSGQRSDTTVAVQLSYYPKLHTR